MTDKNINWDASSFFETLASKNKLARVHKIILTKQPRVGSKTPMR